MRNYFGEAVTILPSVLKAPLLKIREEEKEIIQEIRLRCGQPLMVQSGEVCCFVTSDGKLSTVWKSNVPIVDGNQIQYTLLRACDDSMHTQQEHITQGFVTIPGGHRLGLCGTAVTDGDKLVNVRNISALNLRIAREKTGCAIPLLRPFGNKVPSFLLAGPPSSGKTTLLRDIARLLSSGQVGRAVKVAVVDERSEIAASYGGKSQNDLGPCADILDGYPKPLGISTALRVLSPQFILCDEIGTMDEVQAILPGLNSGVRFILSVHASSREELMRREAVRVLLGTSTFDSVVLLKGTGVPGQVEHIYKAGELTDEAMRADHGVHSLRGNGDPVEPWLYQNGTKNRKGFIDDFCHTK